MPKNIRSIKPTEHQIQCALVKYCNNLIIDNIRIGDYLFSIPNGGFRNKLEAQRLKLEGLKAGVSDLFLALPQFGLNCACGLWIEVKAPDGKLTKSQEEWLEKMYQVSYAVSVIYSIDEGIDAIKKYFGIR